MENSSMWHALRTPGKLLDAGMWGAIFTKVVPAYENGLNNFTPVSVKSFTFRVTSVKSYISAVAAICLSRAFS